MIAFIFLQQYMYIRLKYNIFNPGAYL